MQSLELHKLVEAVKNVSDQDDKSLSKIMCNLHAQVCKCLENREERAARRDIHYNKMLRETETPVVEDQMWIDQFQSIRGTLDHEVTKLLIMVLDVCGKMNIPIEEILTAEIKLREIGES